MPTYKVIKTSNLVNVDSQILIEAETITEAQVKAQAVVDEYNNLGNDHADNWVLKSVTEIISVTPPSQPDPEPIIEAPPRDPE